MATFGPLAFDENFWKSFSSARNTDHSSSFFLKLDPADIVGRSLELTFGDGGIVSDGVPATETF